MGYSPRGRKESDTTEQLHFTFMYGIVNIVSFYFNWLAVGYLKGFGIVNKAKVKESEVAQSCPTLCDPMDCSPPGSSVHGIFQARVLEWVAISFSRRSS